jgi:iron(III) transport system substrate-binding protein
MSIVKGGNKAAKVNAKKLYDWILSSPNAQNILVKWYVVLVRKGAATHPQALSLTDITTIKQDFAWDGDAGNKKRLLDRWTNEIGNKR